MTIDTIKRAAKALIYHNRNRRPDEMGIAFPNAYIVGEHIWLIEHCATDWVSQMDTTHSVEVLPYREAYEFAQTDKQLKYLLN